MKTVLVDDHLILIEGISRLLREPYKIVGIFSDAKEALAFIISNEVDLVITDYEMPGLNGIDLFRKALSHKPLLKGVLLSMHDEKSVVKQALQNGFHGFLLKNVGQTELTLALNKICHGHKYISPELTNKLLANEEEIPLSQRELQVLKLILKEYSNKQIADSLCLSERTVETYRKSLFHKAGTNNVVGLVKFAYQNKLID